MRTRDSVWNPLRSKRTLVSRTMYNVLTPDFVFVNRRRTSCKVYTWDGTGEVLICKRLSRGVFCRINPHYKKQIRMTGSEFAQFFEGLNVSGRILESIPNTKPSKKSLRFIQPYRKIDTAHATKYGKDKATSQSSSRTK